jgi:AraC family transcriptional regulator, arabinose operon regulatory protein
MIFDHSRKISHYQERAAYSEYEYDFFTPPLCVQSSGTARWGRKRYFKRDNSGIFGIELITLGNGYLIQNGKEYIINPGEIYLLRKGCNHLYRAGPAGFLHKRFITLIGSMLDQTLQNLGLFSCDFIKPSDPVVLKKLFHDIDKLIVTKPSGYSITASTLAYRILLELSRSVRPRLPGSINAAIEFMQQHLRESLTCFDFAHAAGLSPTHFNRLFRKHIKTSPMSYFNEQRLSWARHLLDNTQLSVKEIAITVGYDDPFYFSARFRKSMGVSPRLFREKKIAVRNS